MTSPTLSRRGLLGAFVLALAGAAVSAALAGAKPQLPTTPKNKGAIGGPTPPKGQLGRQ